MSAKKISTKKSLSSLAHESKAVPKSQRRRKQRTPVPIASKLAIPSDDGSGTVEVLPKRMRASIGVLP